MKFKKYRFFNFIKTYWIELLLSIIVLCIISVFIIPNIFCFSNNVKILEISLGIIAPLISAIFILFKYKLEKKKIFHDLFSYFNARYDKLNENMNRIKDGKSIIIDKYPFGINKLDERFDADRIEIKYITTNIIYDYLNLCAEEYFWMGQGTIHKVTWDAWEKGMNYFLSCHEVIEVVNKELKIIKIEDKKNEIIINDSYYGFLFSDVVNKALEKHKDCKLCNENNLSETNNSG